MKFIADLHVHSKFSRATAKNLDFENLYIAAQLKGITLVGTGDFTHPAWAAEIQEKLVPAEPGLFKLKDELAAQCDTQVPQSCRREVRFILQCEISNIYKKDGKTRKNHHVIFVPDTETVSRFNAKLDRIGNIKSDGRPILGLDAKLLLQILLETSDDAFLIPAHIWTPWFSVLGSKSGFDSLEECFEELTREIFAAETGLSSDPPMNWRISELDPMTLVSNSDAHSPLNLGRNANMFDTELSYFAIRSALKSSDPAQCLGTIDMYPQEGKYHFDGHRKCNVCLRPSDTMSKKGICPVCGKALTIGVLYRVEELADRADGEKPETALPFHHIIPLAEMLSEILNVGPKTKKVGIHYQTAIETLGAESDILLTCPPDAIEGAGIPLLAEAVRRMREGKVYISPGYDGEYGKITLFTPDEREKLLGQAALFSMPGAASPKKRRTASPSETKPSSRSQAESVPSRSQAESSSRSQAQLGNEKTRVPSSHSQAESVPSRSQAELGNEKKAVHEAQPEFKKKTAVSEDLNDEQQQAVEHEGSPLLIIAGPGAGKTRTLTYRIAHIITRRNIPPENILAVTFTQKAAQEMKDRLKFLMQDGFPMPLVTTFHALCFQLLKEWNGDNYSVIDDEEQKIFISEAVRQLGQKGISVANHLSPPFAKGAGGISPPFEKGAGGISPPFAKGAGGISPMKKEDCGNPPRPPFAKGGRKLLCEMIISAKQQLFTPKDDLSLISPPERKEKSWDASLLPLVYQQYQDILAQECLYDYEDLILNVVKRLESDMKIREACQKRFRYVFADEYQDLNQGQYRIIKALAPRDSEICVIGDPDQSIYGFRGSDVRYFQRFAEDFPRTRSIRLTKNYRSAETILEASHQVIREHSINPAGTRVYSGIEGIKTLSILELATEKAEAVAVGKLIENMVGGTGFHSIDFGKTDETGMETDRGFSDFAVLYRTTAQSQVISDIFGDAGIPHQIANREHAYRRKGIAELLGFLRMTEGIGILSDFQRIIRSGSTGISPAAYDLFKNWFYQNKFTLKDALITVKRLPVPQMDSQNQRKFCAFADKISEFGTHLTDASVEEKLMFLFENTHVCGMIKENPKTAETFTELIRTAKGFGSNSADFFEMIALHRNDADTYDFNAEKVTLMTLHAAKGLEFPVVFVVGCEKDYLPYKRSEEAEVNTDEERRLFYVAMTRAKERLFFTHAKKRTIYGKMLQREISPFVSDIEQHLLTIEKFQAKKQKQEKQVQLGLFL